MRFSMRKSSFVYFAVASVVSLWSIVPVVSIAPPNDSCENAIALQAPDGQVVLGSTVDATIDAINICGENLVSSPGIWYLYQTDIDIIAHVSTCTEQTNFDTAVTIYSGFCDSLQCVDGRDDDLECRDAGTQQHSTIAWQATTGERYYVLVHGSEQNHTGNFGLVLTETEPLEGDDTTSAAYSWNIPSAISVFIAIWAVLT